MAVILLANDMRNIEDIRYKTKIMIFTEGTILGPHNIFQHFNHARYGAIGNAASKIRKWHEQGAEIVYVTSLRKMKEVVKVREILLKNNFIGSYLYYRGKNEKYKDIVEDVMPDILIEDDCKSIGGKWQMCITYVKPEKRDKIKSIVVKEFSGIDNLPDSLTSLMNN